MLGNPQTTKADLHVFSLAFDADRTAPEPLRYCAGSERTPEWIEDKVSCVRASFHDALKKCLGLLARVLLVLRHSIADARDVPSIARNLHRLVRSGNLLAIVDELPNRTGPRFYFNLANVERI